MSHHFNNLTKRRDTLQQTMQTCWQEGRKLIESNPYQGEIYFAVGNACMELLKKLNEEIDTEIQSWTN